MPQHLIWCGDRETFGEQIRQERLEARERELLGARDATELSRLKQEAADRILGEYQERVRKLEEGTRHEQRTRWTARRKALEARRVAGAEVCLPSAITHASPSFIQCAYAVLTHVPCFLGGCAMILRRTCFGLHVYDGGVCREQPRRVAPRSVARK